MREHKDPIAILWRLAVHMLVGVALFVLVLTPALFLGWLLDQLPPSTPVWITMTMQVLEMLLFFLDVLLFGRFTWRAFKQTWDDL